MADTNQDISYKPQWVSLAIFTASLVVWGCFSFGEELHLAGRNPPPALYLGTDQLIKEYHLFLCGGVVFLGALAAAIFLKHKWKRFRYLCNAVAFMLLTAFSFFHTAKAGGISASIYGAAYLSLFSVAIIIPHTLRWKCVTALPVVIFALFMVFSVSEWKRELFICTTSMLGSFLGVSVRWYLTNAMKTQKS